MSIVFNTLEKTFDDVALFIQFFVKIVLNLEIGFIRNTNGCLLLFNESTKKGRRVGSVGKYFFPAMCTGLSKATAHSESFTFPPVSITFKSWKFSLTSACIFVVFPPRLTPIS